MPSSEDFANWDVMDGYGGDGGMGGGYDPTLDPWSDVNGGWVYVPQDPDPGGNTGSVDPSFYGDTNYDPGATGIDPLAGGYYDPTGGNPPDNSAASDPYSFSSYGPLNNYGGAPTGGTGDPSDPYQFSASGTGSTPPTDTTIGDPPDPGKVQIPGMPGGIGTGIQKPYPPTGRMTQGNDFAQRSGSGLSQSSTSPTAKPGAPTQAQPPSSSSISVGLGGPPPIASGLPSDQKFTYTPVSIARQGAPNASSPGPYDFQGQSALGKLAGAFGVPTSAQQIPQALGIPTSLTQLRQQLGLTKAGLPFGQKQNPYDNGV